MKRGFTLIELMVASLLLSMLVTILTMLFNQSSIAWRTGVAGVAKLDRTRRQLGIFHDVRDSALPGLGQGNAYGDSRSVGYRTVSVFQKNSNKPRTDRAYDQINWGIAPRISNAGDRSTKDLNGGEMVGSALFTVGVRSWGPNGKEGDEDDITTWPDEVF